LPPDSYIPPNPANTPAEVLTAGAIFPLTQVPLPISLSGTVFVDANLNNNQDPGDAGIAGVQLALREFNGANYTTVTTTMTDALGDYRFDGVLPGTYEIVETQPDGYFSVRAAGRFSATGAVDENMISRLTSCRGELDR
jgi:hypothetical protein